NAAESGEQTPPTWKYKNLLYRPSFPFGLHSTLSCDPAHSAVTVYQPQESGNRTVPPPRNGMRRRPRRIVAFFTEVDGWQFRTYLLTSFSLGGALRLLSDPEQGSHEN